MDWSNWSEFFAMGGYEVYVWGSYFVTFACVIGEIWLISKRRRTLVKRFGQILDANEEDSSSYQDDKTAF